MTSWFRWAFCFVFLILNLALLFIAFESKTFTIVKSVCLVVSVKIVCAGSMAPVWDCWKKMFQTVTLATSAETHQVREKNLFIYLFFKSRPRIILSSEHEGLCRCSCDCAQLSAQNLHSFNNCACAPGDRHQRNIIRRTLELQLHNKVWSKPKTASFPSSSLLC